MCVHAIFEPHRTCLARRTEWIGEIQNKIRVLNVQIDGISSDNLKKSSDYSFLTRDLRIKAVNK